MARITPQVRCNVHLLEELDLRLPFWQYYAALGKQPYSCLLDSAKDPEKLGQYSFICGDPFVVFRAKRRPGTPPGAGATIEVVTRNADAPPVARFVADPFEELRRRLAEFKVEYDDYVDHPVPFLSGAFGYFGYEAGYFIESLPDTGADDLALPDMYLVFVDSLIAHCHKTGKSYLSVIGRGKEESVARDEAGRLRDQWLKRIEKYEATPQREWAVPPERRPASPIDIRYHFDETTYARAVQTVKEYIYSGNAYEVCLTHRLDAPLAADSWDLYRELRRINPSPFSAFVNFPEVQAVCSSPERFLRLDADRIAESRPIKGTRSRGRTAEQDAALYRDLLGSVKDRAENMMIVDLVRNDLGRISKFGSVHVPELMAIEKYATVFQMVSTIRGELEESRDNVDLIKACFPGGSMTGAPKIEAMKIIDHLEPVKRGIYSGAIGYIDFSGNMDLSMVIRTMIVKDQRCYLNVGGAVVADSDPVGEYVETMDKARALIMALENVRRIDR
jgi:aminodeoxychorismate synthase component I